MLNCLCWALPGPQGLLFHKSEGKILHGRHCVQCSVCTYLLQCAISVHLFAQGHGNCICSLNDTHMLGGGPAQSVILWALPAQGVLAPRCSVSQLPVATEPSQLSASFKLFHRTAYKPHFHTHRRSANSATACSHTKGDILQFADRLLRCPSALTVPTREEFLLAVS